MNPTAEQSFRDAFERLKLGTPCVLPKGTSVTQNNVAREAGCDPSALRKSRYPSLIEEIRRWIEDQAPAKPQSMRQAGIARRNQNRALKEKLAQARAQRDQLASLLVEADAKIVELTLENARLSSLLPTSNVTSLLDKKAG